MKWAPGGHALFHTVLCVRRAAVYPRAIQISATIAATVAIAGTTIPHTQVLLFD
jgi:hypothetical protein